MILTVYMVICIETGTITQLFVFSVLFWGFFVIFYGMQVALGTLVESVCHGL